MTYVNTRDKCVLLPRKKNEINEEMFANLAQHFAKHASWV